MNSDYLNPNQVPDYIDDEGRQYIHDADSNTLKPMSLPEVAFSGDARFAGNIQDEGETTTRVKIEKKRVYSFGSRVALGGLVVGLVVIPPAVHFGAELATHSVINGIDQRPDREITFQDLLGDVGQSVTKMMGGS